MAAASAVPRQTLVRPWKLPRAPTVTTAGPAWRSTLSRPGSSLPASRSAGCPPRAPRPGRARAGRGSRLETRRFPRAAGRIAGLVGGRARPGELAALDDQVLLADRPVLEPALQDLAGARGVAGLRRQRRTRDMRGHAMMRHAAPRVIPGGGLRKPDITGVARQLPAFQRPDDGIAVADLPPR